MIYGWRLECEDCNELCLVENEYSKDEPEVCPYCSSPNIIVEYIEEVDDEFEEEDDE
jgi:hypothetical protein